MSKITIKKKLSSCFQMIKTKNANILVTPRTLAGFLLMAMRRRQIIGVLLAQSKIGFSLNRPLKDKGK